MTVICSNDLHYFNECLALKWGYTTAVNEATRGLFCYAFLLSTAVSLWLGLITLVVGAL
jgi:hypothetical protein